MAIFLPQMVYGGADVFIINGFDSCHLFRCQVGQFRSFHILEHLCGFACAGNDHADSLMHENPTQSVRNEVFCTQQGFQFRYGCQTQFIIHAGEGFAFVKGFPVAVVETMVVFAKDGLW